MVDSGACLEDRTVVKPALIYFLYNGSKINFKTYYLYGWFKGNLRKQKCFITYFINFPLCLFVWVFFICLFDSEAVHIFY